MKKSLIVLLIILGLCITAAAEAVPMTVDGKEYSGAVLVGNTTYVPLRSFADLCGNYNISWNSTNSTAGVSAEGVSMFAAAKKPYVESNGRIIYCGKSNFISNDSIYVPVRSAGKALGVDVEWNSSKRSVSASVNGKYPENGETFYDKNDLYWLAKIINAESAGEPIEGKIGVGNVVLNRVSDGSFPNNVYDVIFDRAGGVQFTPVANGSINQEASAESVIAAKACLEDYKVTTKNILFFLNPRKSNSTWIQDNQNYVMTIGRHDFYA